MESMNALIAKVVGGKSVYTVKELVFSDSNLRLIAVWAKS